MRDYLVFARPYQVEIRQESLPPLQNDEVIVKTTLSAISAGTEMLFYRGQVPSEMSVDTTISGMAIPVSYPLAYGYCTVGKVTSIGSDVNPDWIGRRVFAFEPHATDFVTKPSALLRIPDGLSDEQAVFLPNMETAINFVMDGSPLIGDRVVVFGLGVVGMLTSVLLSTFPLGRLCVIDGYAKRRALAENLVHCEIYSPEQGGLLQTLDPDLIFEVSSNPSALSTAVEIAGFGARIVVGSWYGDKTVQLPLGGMFHRNRVQLISSQVSSVDGRHSNRWNKLRRLQSAWEKLREIPVEHFITQRVPFMSAAQAYHLVDEHPDQTLQVVLTY